MGDCCDYGIIKFVLLKILIIFNVLIVKNVFGDGFIEFLVFL